MLSLRIASAAVAVPLLLALGIAGERGTPGGYVYGAVLVIASLVAAFEGRTMMRNAGREPVDPVLVGLAGFLPFHAWFMVSRTQGQPLFGSDGMVLVGVAVMVSLLLPMRRRRLENVLMDWATSLAFGFYVGGLMQFFGPLRDRPDGAYWAISTVGLSFVCDTAAYFVGRAFGRTQLAPLISPKKSVEGAIGGLITTAAFAAAWGAVATGLGWAPPHAWAYMAGFGAAIAFATISGDLAESLLKRQTGVKDSGMLIPGHGGLLDRLDSLLFCAPVAVMYLQAFRLT